MVLNTIYILLTPKFPLLNSQLIYTTVYSMYPLSWYTNSWSFPTQPALPTVFPSSVRSNSILLLFKQNHSGIILDSISFIPILNLSKSCGLNLQNYQEFDQFLLLLVWKFARMAHRMQEDTLFFIIIYYISYQLIIKITTQEQPNTRDAYSKVWWSFHALWAHYPPTTWCVHQHGSSLNSIVEDFYGGSIT